MDTNTAENKEKEISPLEDLMREHGLLHRILSIYNEAIKCLKGLKVNNKVNIYDVIYNTAVISQQFIENYHQKLEEHYIFPKFSKSPEYGVLIRTLLTQHYAAHNLTENILHFSSQKNNYYFDNNLELIHLLSLYIDMYEPHSSREDTVLFPSFHEMSPPDEYIKLGEVFEDIEEKNFGKDGFKHMVNKVEKIEKVLGIYDLGQFTPKLYSLPPKR